MPALRPVGYAAVWFSADKKCTKMLKLCVQDCQVFVWTVDVTTGSYNWTPKLLHKFNDVVWHLSWSVTGNILAVSGGDNKVTRSVLELGEGTGTGWVG